jgi:PHD/YefM family antitoxin component YafN of YafNO toxin-antitoxin module
MEKLAYRVNRGAFMDTIPQFHPEYVIDGEGNKKAVILPIEEYEELLEDLEDLAVAAERKNEPTVSHEQLLTELNKATPSICPFLDAESVA